MCTDHRHAVSQLLRHIWRYAQPLLFCLIGAAVDVKEIEPEFAGYGILALVIGLLIRTLVAFLSVFCTRLSVRERLFVALTWLPKATVQAAVGSVALDTAREQGGDPVDVRRGIFVLTIAVLSILGTAPIGAAIVSCTGPRLLRQKNEEKEPEDGVTPSLV